MTNVQICETENPPIVVSITPMPRLRCALNFTQDFRIRRLVEEKIIMALEILPLHLGLLIYEAYRPIERQKILWNNVWTKLAGDHPDWAEAHIKTETEKFVANPYTTGSGHQAAAAIDVYQNAWAAIWHVPHGLKIPAVYFNHNHRRIFLSRRGGLMGSALTSRVVGTPPAV